MVLDSHVHFWNYHPAKDAWIKDDMMVIKKDFLPQHINPLLTQNNIDGCIAIQGRQNEEETDYLVTLANKNNFIKGVVGWIDLCAANVEERLYHFSKIKGVKGFRHIVEAEPKGFLLKNDFIRGIKALSRFTYTYDILIQQNQFEEALLLVAKFDEQPFVIDHIGKPSIKHNGFEDWSKNISKFKDYENVFCKISGMVTEAEWKNWKKDDFIKYIDTVLETFGTKRIMFGSDWPVCLLAAEYNEVYNIVHDYFQTFSKTEQKQFWGSNAKTFYNIV